MWSEAAVNAGWGLLGGALGALVAGPAGSSAATVLSQYLKHPIKQFFVDYVETAVVDIINWIYRSIIEGYFENIA